MTENDPKRVRTEGPKDGANNPSAFAWKLCAEDDDIAKRMPIKEYAAERGLHHLTQLCDLLRRYAHNDNSAGAKSLRQFIESSDNTIEKHRQFEVLVGVTGVTGAGKTSLLNALLGIKELLPSSQEQAATAVSCKISWNFDMTPGREFRAEIFFQSHQEIQRQIVLTLEAFKTYEIVKSTSYLDKNQGVQEMAEAAAAKKEGMDKIHAVWRVSEQEILEIALACNEPKDFFKAAQKILDANEAVLDFLKDGILNIHCESENDLRDHIKPFLDSTAAQHGHTCSFAAWPLIKDVQVYIRSEILKTGICLVDLPGVGDNVESRAKIAEGYRRKLEVTMIVAPMIRAADERCTQKLLNTSQELRIQMSGATNPHAFGVVLSKMDDLDTEGYVKTKKDEHDSELNNHLETLNEARKQLKSALEEKRAMDKASKKAKTQIKKLGSGNNAKNKDKQLKISAAVTERKMAEERSQELDDVISNLDNKIKLSSVHRDHWAHVKRNDWVKSRFTADFNRRQAQLCSDAGVDHVDDMAALDVLSSSSRAFWDLYKEEKMLTAFPTDRHTGIPSVVSWIHRATATRREQHLDLFLAQLRDSLGAIDQWCKKDRIELPVHVDVQALRAKLALAYTEFGDDLSRSFMRFFKGLQGNDPLMKKTTTSIKKEFRELAPEVAVKWAMKWPDDETVTTRMVWNTYLGIANRQGGPYTSPSNRELEYDWIAKLVEPLILRLKKVWSEFNMQISRTWKSQEADVNNIFKEHFAAIVKLCHEVEPSLQGPICQSIGKPNNACDTVNSEVRVALGTFQRGTDIYETASNAMRRSLEKPFAACKDITGKGSYIARRQLLEQTVERNANKYFDAAWNSMKSGVIEARSSLNGSLNYAASHAVERARAPIDLFIDNTFGDTNNPKKLDAQSQVQSILAAWREDWYFPRPDTTHILARDESIPTELDPKDLEAYLEKEESDVGSDVSDDEDAKDKVKSEPQGETTKVKEEPQGSSNSFDEQ